jgi:hypothetical protein
LLIQGTSDHGIRIFPTTDKLIGHADSDWAGESDRKLVSGFVGSLGDVPVALWSKKQTAVALSSIEAEYASLSETSKEKMWLRGLCKALGHNQNGGTMIMQENSGGLRWANGTAKFGPSKHVDIKLLHVQHLVQSEDITLQQVGMLEMKADLLTKPLTGTIFKKSRGSLQITNQIAPRKPLYDDNSDRVFTALLGVSRSSKEPVEHQDRYNTCLTRTSRKWSNENLRKSHMCKGISHTRRLEQQPKEDRWENFQTSSRVDRIRARKTSKVNNSRDSKSEPANQRKKTQTEHPKRRKVKI